MRLADFYRACIDAISLPGYPSFYVATLIQVGHWGIGVAGEIIFGLPIILAVFVIKEFALDIRRRGDNSKNWMDSGLDVAYVTLGAFAIQGGALLAVVSVLSLIPLAYWEWSKYGTETLHRV